MKFSKSYLALAVTFSAALHLFGQKSLVKAVYNNNYPKIISMNGGKVESTKKDYNNQRALAFSYYQTDQVNKATESYKILFNQYAVLIAVKINRKNGWSDQKSLCRHK